MFACASFGRAMKFYFVNGNSFHCVDVKSVTVIRMTVARQSLNKAYSVSHQNQRKKLRRHKLKGR